MGENAQEELTIGVGALAGSTIMLLTIPWFLSVVGGRVKIDPVSGTALYKYVHSSLIHSLIPSFLNYTLPPSINNNNTEQHTRRPPGAPKETWTKLPSGFDLKHHGVGIMAPVRISALIMLGTSINYLLIQIPAFVYASDKTTAALAKDERPWALVGLLTSLLSFLLYLWYQWTISGTDEVKNDKIAEITLKK